MPIDAIVDASDAGGRPTTAGGPVGGASGETRSAGSGTEPGLETGHLGRRNERILIGAVAGYIAILSALMIAKGVSITPDVLLVALGLAALILGRGRLFLRDWIPFIGLFFAYELMRGYADNFGAAVHVTDVVAIERFLFGGNLPTQALQDWLHPASGTDWIAVVATIFYFLHFPLPIAVGFFLWLKRRRMYYDYVAALILLSMAGFLTYLVLPVAPPWWAAEHGAIPAANGAPAIEYLKQQGFDSLASMFGFQGNYVFSYTIYDINPNPVAAFPSLHAGYPFLAFLFARRSFGRPGWLMLGYAACVWFSVVYLADHYVLDILGGLAYASVAYWAVMHGPARLRRLVERAANEPRAAGTAEREDVGALGRLGGQVRWPIVVQGAAIAIVGGLGIAFMVRSGALGGAAGPLYLVPWAAFLGGLWRLAVRLVAR